MRSIELFSGAGGLAMGMTLAGIKHEAIIERDKWACDTIRENKKRGFPLVSDWPVHQCDVRSFDYGAIGAGIDIVAGGPPCQPFSLGGKHKAYNDPRDMFPSIVEAIRCLRPKAFIVENVKGLTRSSFANYFQYIQLQLRFPEIIRNNDEDWEYHRARLEQHATSGRIDGLAYDLITRVLNAADYGVPQQRERVFMVGFRHDLDIQWSFPDPTHSHDALLRKQWIDGEYWDRHRIVRKNRPSAPSRLANRLERLRKSNVRPDGEFKPWRTVRDAIGDLPDPTISGRAEIHRNHRFQAGARIYKGHTGSPLDSPAKTLKAGDHGVPGGENMLVREDGTVRYFTVRESARLQSFPDGYVFHGSWTEAMRQLGNAVPVELARIVASSVTQELLAYEESSLVKQLQAGRAA